MSERLSAAAAALGAPEALVERSARARAAAQGIDVEEILAAWAGGGTVPSAPALAPEAPPTEAPTEEAGAPPPAAPEPAPTAQPEPTPAPAATPAPVAVAVAVAAPARDAAPLLEGRRESLGLLLTGVLGLLILGVMLVFVIPAAVGGDERHIVADAALSDLEARGREIYLEQGCQYCHTQNVRPVIADVGLGPVTETDARSLRHPATFGVQRIGPDLAHVASRLAEGGDPAAFLAEFLDHPTEVNPESRQPAYRYLSDDDMAALIAYLLALK